MTLSTRELRSRADDTGERKEAAAVERKRTNSDVSALNALNQEIIDIPAEVEQYVDEYAKELKGHGKDIDDDIAKINRERQEIRDESDKHLETLYKLRESLREKRKASATAVGETHIDKIKETQEREIQEITRIKIEMDERDANFEELLSEALPYYRNAELVSAARFEGKREDLAKMNDFTGHTERHIREVREKMKGMQSSLASVIGGAFDARTLDAAAAFHDTGLDADLTKKFRPWFVGAFRGDMNNMNPSGQPRDRHTITGAVNALRHREKLESLGTNADQSAFLIYLHSKRGFDELSGEKGKEVRDLNQSKSIIEAALKFQGDCERRGVKWNMSWLQDKNGEWNDEALRRTAISASLLRLADANRDGERLYAQNGASYIFANEEKSSSLKKVMDYKGHEDLKERMLREVDDITISYYEKTTCREALEPFSRAIVYGEHNVSRMNLEKDESGELVYHFVIKDARNAVGCTTHAIWERLAEIKSSSFSGLGGRIVLECEKGDAGGLLKCLKNTTDGKDYSLPPNWSFA